MDDLCLRSDSQDKTQEASSTPNCEKLLWAKCSDDGHLEPLVGTGKGKSIRKPEDDAKLWGECVKLGLQPLLPDYESEDGSGDETKFDLILCIRFHPRALLSRLSQLVRVGGVVLLSHFVTLSDAQQERALLSHPDATMDYDSPPHEGRIQPGEVESLIDRWNQSVEPRFRWIIDSDVLEPIEDGRIIKSVALRKIPV